VRNSTRFSSGSVRFGWNFGRRQRNCLGEFGIGQGFVLGVVATVTG